MWDLSSPTRDRTCNPCIGRRSLKHWTVREVPKLGVPETKGLPIQVHVQDLQCGVKAISKLLALGDLSLVHQRNHYPFSSYRFLLEGLWPAGPSAEGVGPYTGTQPRELLLALGHPSKVTLGTAPLPGMGLEKRGKVRDA